MTTPATGPEARVVRARRLVGLGILLLTLAATVVAAVFAYDGWTRAWAGFAYGAPSGGRLATNAPPALTLGGLRAPAGRVVQIVPHGPAAKAGVTMKQRVLAIDGHAIEDSAAIAGIAAAARPRQVVRYRVREDAGGERDLDVRLATYAGHPRAAIRIVTFGLLAVSFLSLGLFLFWRRPLDIRLVLFFALCASSAYTFVLLPFMSFDDALRGLAPGLGFPPGKYAAFSAAGLLGVCFLSALWHFALVFPRRRPAVVRRPWLIAWVYGAPVVLVAFFLGAMCAGFLGRGMRDRPALLLAPGALAILAALWGRPRDGRHHHESPVRVGTMAFGLAWLALALMMIYRQALGHDLRAWLVGGLFALPGFLMLAFYLVVPFAVMIALVNSYRESPLDERQQIKWPLWAIGINTIGGLLLGTVSLAVSLMFPPAVVHETEWVTSLLQVPLYLCLPIGFAIGILRYRLMDLDLVVRRTSVYAAVTTLMIVVYLLLVGGLGGWIVQTMGVRSTWVTVFGTLGVAAMFVPVRNRVQAIIDRRFDRTRYESGASLQRLSHAFAEARGAREHGRAVVEELHRSLRARTALVLVPDAAGRALVPCAALGLADGVEGDLPPAALRATAAALVDGEARLGAPDPLRDLARRAEAEIVVPVRRRRELLGVILLGRRLSEQAFEVDDLEYLAAVAGQLGMALADLDTPEARREIDEAREIQSALLPRRLPELPGIRMAAHWQPAREVAGDYYDVLALEGGLAALCIADVAGKGMPAALLMSNLQATVKTFSAASSSPAELCARVNRVLVGHLAPGRFITLFYGVIDPARRLVYTNAGHNPPLLLHADGSTEKLEIGGTLLGAFPDAKFEEAEVTLQPGDRLALYTDGVTEAMNEAHELYGEDRLIEVLRANASEGPETLQARVLESVSTFCEGNFEDDATLVVVAVQ